MAKIELPYVAWRGGRPRFVPGARERAVGWKGQDLKHDDGRWFSLDEAHRFAIARRDEIREQRQTGQKLKAPPAPKGRAFSDLWHAYTNSNEFKGNPAKAIKGLSPSSQASYAKWIKPLMDEPVWHAPIASLDPVVMKGVHEAVLAKRTKSMANYCISAASAALSWGRLRGWFPKVHGFVPANPASRLDLPPLAARIRIATDVEIRSLVEASDRVQRDGVLLSSIGDAILTGLFSGQRKKDVLEFVPGAQSNSRIELVQSKTGARVSIPMAPRLVERLADARARRARADRKVVAPNVVINESTGRPYNGHTFRQHFVLVRAEAVKACPSLADFTYPDLRDTAVTWLARAGSTVPEIASITGHSMASIYTILKHYLAVDAQLADNAVRKLVDWMEREGMAV